ncbi:EF-hand calcium-binding domain-containing protein 6 isoform X2 [Amia ocellicauda]|uniref:EF-hand calcium-binding domain-containing protein 6 isoform X2 n=1 Tax=Amia ocellicauda TaxID=2972642 RepID=UPI0034645F13
MALAVMKRPVSHTGILSKLPEIQHPLARLGDPDSFSVDGFATQGATGRRDVQSACWDRTQRRIRVEKECHPLLEDIVKKYKFKKLDSWKKVDQWINLGDRKWSDGGSVTQGGSLTSCRPATHTQLQIEELELLLSDKIKSGGFYTLKRLFMSNDPTGKGNVSRDVLLVILTKFLGRFISRKEFSSLLGRLNLAEKSTVPFDNFCRCVGKRQSGNEVERNAPIKRTQDTKKKNAIQAHLALRKLAKERPFEMRSLFDEKEEAPLQPSDLRRVLCQLGIQTCNEEFDKLWKRYHKEGGIAITVESLMKTLGSEAPSPAKERRSRLLSSLSRMSSASLPRDGPKLAGERPSKSQQERDLSLHVEKWLKEKFTEGYKDMMVEFRRFDPKNSRKVSREDFLQVLGRFHLHLKQDQLSLFLARCGLDDTSPDVNYEDFLLQYQDRTDRGMMGRVLAHPHHRFNHVRSLSDYSTLSALEAKLLNMLQTDFLSLLHEFHKMDTGKLDTVNQQQFRSAIERRFSMKMTGEEFECLLEKAPLDKHGNIRYLEFLNIFNMSRDVSSVLDDGRTVVTHFSRKPHNTDQRKSFTEGTRTNLQLTKKIKDLVKDNYEEVEKAFNDLDEMNTGRLSQDTLYQLLKRFPVHPPISRAEVGQLWKTLIRNQDDTLDFLHFVRHFVFSRSSACFQNSKRVPPLKGDSDFLIRSRKLNSDTEITMDHLCAQVQLLLDDLRTQFQELDPDGSGTVTQEEFQDVLTDLCRELTATQCKAIASKFSCRGNRTSYVDFLHPFEEQKQDFKVSPSKAVTQRPETHLPVYSETTLKGLNGITEQLRRKLAGDWKSLQRACKKLDNSGSGYLLLPEFRSVLKLCNAVLDEEEIYRLMSHFDKNMTGKLNYAKFIDETVKNSCH